VHEVGTPADGARAIAVTDDSAAWVVLGAVGAIVRFVPGQEPRRFDLGSQPAALHSVAPATRDSVWVTDRGSNRILRLDESGIAFSVDVPTPRAGPAGIVGLDDGSAWFIEEDADALGRIDILGRITEFATGADGGQPSSIASDGISVWFGLPGAAAIAYARGGDSQPRLVQLDDPLAAPVDLSVGDDGRLWFADHARRLLGRLDRRGAVEEFTLPVDFRPIRVSSEGAGGCWFTVEAAGSIGHVDEAGRVTTVPIPGGRGLPVAIAVSRSREVWVALDSGTLVQLVDPGKAPAGIQ
jgi:virginiamycin B lyase